jgi:hypothetical protein
MRDENGIPAVIVPPVAAAVIASHIRRFFEREFRPNGQRLPPGIADLLDELDAAAHAFRSRKLANQGNGSSGSTSTHDVPTVLSVNAVANQLNLSGRRVRMMCSDGSLDASTALGAWQINPDSLDSLLESRNPR